MKKKRVDKDYVEQGAASIHEDDIHKAAENSKKIDEKVKKSKSLRQFLIDLKLMGSLVKDYSNGTYKKIPYKAIAVIVFTLLYVLNVVDLVPDFIPGLGLIDDVSVIAFSLKIVSSELEKYKNWKSTANSVSTEVDQ